MRRRPGLERPAWFGDHSGASWGYAIHPEVTDLEGGPLGRPTGVTDRAQTTALLHDRRGHVIWTGRLLAVIGAPGGAASSLSGDDPSTPDGSAEGITLASVVYDGMDDLDGNAQLDGPRRVAAGGSCSHGRRVAGTRRGVAW